MMKLLWKCPWDDGQVSFVLARSRAEAVAIIEEIGTVDPLLLTPVDHRTPFIVTFFPCYEKLCTDGNAGGFSVPADHWHANDHVSEGVWQTLGEPPPLPPPPPKSLPPPDPLEPTCQKCGHARFASVHHPAYDRANKCEFEAAAAPVEPPALGPDRPTSE